MTRRKTLLERAIEWPYHFFGERGEINLKATDADLRARLEGMNFTEIQAAILVEYRPLFCKPRERARKYLSEEKRAARIFLDEMANNNTFPLSRDKIEEFVKEHEDTSPEAEFTGGLVVARKNSRRVGSDIQGSTLLRFAKICFKSKAEDESAIKEFLLDVWLPPYHNGASIDELLKGKVTAPAKRDVRWVIRPAHFVSSSKKSAGGQCSGSSAPPSTPMTGSTTRTFTFVSAANPKAIAPEDSDVYRPSKKARIWSEEARMPGSPSQASEDSTPGNASLDSHRRRSPDVVTAATILESMAARSGRTVPASTAASTTSTTATAYLSYNNPSAGTTTAQSTAQKTTETNRRQAQA
jgi:hypothetical protein